MACSECYSGSTVAIEGGSGISVTGTGTPGDKYVVSLTEMTPQEELQILGPFEPSGTLNLAPYGSSYLVDATLTSDLALSLPTSVTGGRARVFVLTLRQDGAGSRTVDFDGAGVVSSAPIVLSTAPFAVDIITLLWTGQEWVGIITALGVA
jgi:hypothetical protein